MKTKQKGKIKYLFKDYKYDKDIDILVRVYDSQNKNVKEEEQCFGEILFKPHMKREHIRFCSWLPRGLASAVSQYIKPIKGDYKIQISNELPDNIGVLTSCRYHFDIRVKEALNGNER